MKKEDFPIQMIFVVGAPRSGTHLLLDFLTVPKTVSWIPERLMQEPGKLSLASRANRLNWPLLGEFFLERRHVWNNVPSPGSGAEFWAHTVRQFCPPDAEPYVPGPEHVSEEEAESLREAVHEICHLQRRNVFAASYEGLPRIRLLRSVFPTAKFIQVIRDPRSVAYQMVKKSGGGHHPLWKHREQWSTLMPEALQQRLSDLPDSPLNFCGVLVRWYHELYKQEMEDLPREDAREIAYSDLLSRPDLTLKKVMDFAGLPVNKRFNYFVKFHDIQQSNQRTNRNLNAEEADQLARAVDKI